MNTLFADWLEKDLAYRAESQRTQVEAAKLLSTLGVAIAGTFLSGALQAGRDLDRERVSIWLMGGAFVGVILVIMLDRRTVVDHQSILANAALGQFESAEKIEQLRAANIVSILNNDVVVNQVRIATAVTLLLSLVSAAFATVSML